MDNWKELISSELAHNGETWFDVVFNTMTEEEMLKDFDSGFGCIKGCSFTVWTNNRVYFPVCYDGAEWVGSVSRSPGGIPTAHQGGG